MALWNLLLISQLLLVWRPEAASAPEVGDESCLLQTHVNAEVRRLPHSTRHSRENEDENQDESENEAPSRESENENEDEDENEDEMRMRMGDLQIGAPVPEFEIDLDKPAGERFREVAETFKDQFVAMFSSLHNSSAGQRLEKNTVLYRGPEDPDLQAEIQMIANITGVPEYHVQGQQFIGPFQTMKGPFYLFLHAQGKPLPTDEKMIKTMNNATFLRQFPSFGCSGVLAKDSKDGSVWHARNLDFGFSRWIQPMAYNAIFKKGGKELYTGNMIFPVQQVLTAIRRGPNGYTYELNTRFGDTIQDTQGVMMHLFSEKRPLALWSTRKALEDNDNYEDFVKAIKTTRIPNKEYAIISGIKKGTVIARDPDGVAYAQELDDKNPVLIMTNFDSKNEDPKEWLVPYKHKGVSARVRAENMIKGKKITPALLKKVLADEEVQVPSTIYSSLMNVEHNSFLSSLPECAHCGPCDKEDPSDCDPDYLDDDSHAFS